MSKNCEHGHQKRQNDDAVLIVSVELLKQPGEAEKARYLEQMYDGTLHNKGTTQQNQNISQR